MERFLNVCFYRVKYGMTAVLILCALAAVPAQAEPERYGFPTEPSVKFVTVTKPKAEDLAAAAPEARKVNEAKRSSIAALLRRYNKKLDDGEAYEYANLIIDASDKFGQNPFVIASMVVLESSARNDAVSKGGDYGLMQVRWRVHQKRIKSKYPHIETAKDMFNPKDNLLVGTEIFSTYRATANQDVRGALMYYTSGNRRMTDRVFSLVAQLEKSYLKYLHRA